MYLIEFVMSRSFQRLVSSHIYSDFEKATDRWKKAEKEAQSLKEERDSLIKELEQQRITNLDLRKQNEEQLIQNESIQKELKLIRRELHTLVGFSFSFHIEPEFTASIQGGGSSCFPYK